MSLVISNIPGDYTRNCDIFIGIGPNLTLSQLLRHQGELYDVMMANYVIKNEGTQGSYSNLNII